MNLDEILDGLHPLEVRVLRALEEGDRTDREVVEEGAVTAAQMRTVIEWLTRKEVLRVGEETACTFVELAETGEAWLRDGVPELRVLQALDTHGPLRVPELSEKAGVPREEVGSAVGALKKAGCIAAGEAGALVLGEAPPAAWLALREALSQVGASGRMALADLPEEERRAAQENSRKRGKGKGVFRLSDEVTRRLELTDAGREVLLRVQQSGLQGDEVNQLTPAMLKEGTWREARFRRYNLKLSPPRHVVGKRHPYRAFLDQARRKLLSLGFEEMTGPVVESEFWDMDALYMPQFHPAREIHDAYYVKSPTHCREIPEPYASRVAAVHTDGGDTGSRGWRYPFDRDRTRRLLLRTQGTALSARWLHRAKVPGKYFAMARCLRYDTVDATHACDFFQVEGIVLGEDITLRSLLGLLEVFARDVARARRVHFRPDYFPFTEPSVEASIEHPTIGWMEMGGAGLFRPEVTRPQGVDVPVIAWGLGLDRMAMTALGITDIRDLFSPDLSRIRARRVPLEE